MNLSFNSQMLVVVIVAILSGTATAMIHDRLNRLDMPPPQIAVINPTVLVAEQVKQIPPGLDDATIKANGQAFAKRLDAAITQVSRKYNAVILVSPAVITGAPDLTEEVRRRLHGSH